MKRLLLLAGLAVSFFAASVAPSVFAADAPLRVFIRSGPKTHGPGQHDYPRFLAEWTSLLNQRGARASGADTFPSAQELAATDVLILHAREAGNIPAAEDRANLNAFLARGGGLVVIHGAAVSRDPAWYKSIIGGSWRHGTTKWFEGPMHLYIADRHNPITRGASNWSMDDEIYYDMDISPDVHVLATAYTPKAYDTGGRGNLEAQARAAEAVAQGKSVNIYDIQPQMWTFERTIDGGVKPYRAFVSIPGHRYENFERPNYRAILLRGIAWAGQRANIDEFCRDEELGDALRYPEGGPTHPAKAAAKIEVHPEFNLSLVAAEPLINKVMNLQWDERGRMWVCETPEYPNGRRAPNVAPWKESGSLDPHRTGTQAREPEDRISILTDANRDGVMDNKHVFADRLELVTSFVLHKKGVIAATAPDIWFLEDTDGDEVADKRTKLYSGLGINDTHAVINNLRWGLDGWIYATHGYSRGEVKSGDGTKTFGSANSGVVRFKPDGSAFEQYSSRGGNTWGLATTWDGQIFWTQPTSGTVFFHTLLPESILAKAKIPGTNSWKGMITDQRTFPAMTWPEQAYVQIDQVGRFTAAAGCAIYEGGAWPDKWNYSYFTGEATLNIVHHQFIRPDGISYTSAKEAGREETEFMRSTDLWFRPIDTRIGPDGALYVIDFYNQAVIHNDTRGPQHGPANAAVRPDRDHFFSRIWRVQHKQAKRLEAPSLNPRNLADLLRTIETSPNATVKKIAWRLVRENHGSEGARALAALERPIGSKALARYETAHAASTPAERQALLTNFARATDDWTKSAIVAAAADHPVDYVMEALRSAGGAELTGFVSALVPAIEPANAGRLLQACAEAGAQANAVKTTILRGLTAQESAPPVLDGALSRSLEKLMSDPATEGATLPLLARWDRSAAYASTIDRVVRRMFSQLADPAVPDARRAEVAASLLAVPKSRDEALAKAGALLADPNTSENLRAPLTDVVGELSGREPARVLIAAYARTKSAAIFEQLMKRPEAALALLKAIEAGQVSASDLGPGNIARLRTHPNRPVWRAAAALFAPIHPESKQKHEVIEQLKPEVIKPGDAAKGKALFTAACAVCHKLGDVGLRDVGPPLAGMGAHGAAELLVHIVDPNRQVEPSFWQWNITTKKGETFVGVIANENATSLTLRNQGGDTEVKKADIAKRENTRRSLMPEGLEGLGVEALRDLLTYIVATSASLPAAQTAANPSDASPKAGGRGDSPLPETKPVSWETGKTRVLLIGGGSSHKFGEFFGAMDGATLRAAGFTVHYTEDRDQAATELAGADVAVISVNRKFFDTPAYRKALFDFAAAGKGIVMMHPGTWYGYAQWPELNAKIVGGGARGHDKIGRFSINAVNKTHPIMRGVPASFEVEDELYYFNANPEKIPDGTASIDVLAETSPSVKFKRPHPAVWTTQHESARIVGITIGHDQRVHDHPAFKTLLTNAVRWAGGK